MTAIPDRAWWPSARPPARRRSSCRTSVGEVNDKVDSLGRSVEETQERTRQNEAKIADVDQKAQNAANSAQQANGAAADAKNTAVDARSAANTVGSKLDTFDKASRRLVYEVVLSEDQGNFKFGKAELPDEIKQKIDQMVSQLKEDPKNVFIEIEGHTDNIGPPETQREDRARARRGRAALSLRAASDSAAQDERHQLRRIEAGRRRTRRRTAAPRTGAWSFACSRSRWSIVGSRGCGWLLTAVAFCPID